MKVSIEITNTMCKILDNLTPSQLGVIQNICSFEVEGGGFKAEALNKRTRGKAQWDGIRRLFDVRTKSFPIGLYSRVRDCFTNAYIDVIPVDKRTRVQPSLQLTARNYQDRQYQSDAVLQSVLYGNGIVKAATGSGKTTMGGRTICAFNKASVFIVHTKDLLYQTIESFKNMIDGCEIGQIGDGIVNIQPITVATVQSLIQASNRVQETYIYDEDNTGGLYEQSFDMDDADKAKIRKWIMTVGTLIFDEVQRVGSRTAFDVRMLFRNADNVYGYSASPWRDDGSDLMIEAAFGTRIVDIKASGLIRQGYLVKPIINIKRLTNNIWSGSTYEQVYKSAIVENTFRNMQVSQDAYDYYNNHMNTLVLVTQIKHGDMIESMLRSMGAPAIFISGRSNMKYRTQVINDMRSGKAPIVIASTIADVGLDVPRLQAIVEAGAGKSSVTALQRLGRIMRPFDGKDLCYFTTYHDMAPYINRHIEKKVDIWKTEEEFVINRL